MMAVVYLIHQYGIRNRLTQRLVLRRSYDEPAPE
jgi:hypothetical protein